MNSWTQDLLADPEALSLAEKIIDDLDPEDLEAWGYPRDSIFDELEGQSAKKTKASAFNSYRFKRQVLLKLRQNIHENNFGNAVKKVRYYCDVLLR